MKKVIFRQLNEGIGFTLNELKSNKFRTFLSLLSVSIGIFTLVAVFTAIDALKASVKQSLDTVGSNLIMVSIWPIGPEKEDGEVSFGADGEDIPEWRWWDYAKRPAITFENFKYLQEHLPEAKYIGFEDSFSSTVKFGRQSIEGVSITCCTKDIPHIFNFNIESGRLFSEQEQHSGSQVALLGADIANTLFNGANPIDKHIKIGGFDVVVIGVLKKSGEGMAFNIASTDDNLFIPYNYGKRFINQNNAQGDIIVAGEQDKPIEPLVSEVRAHLRLARRLRPSQKNNFSASALRIFQDAAAGIMELITNVGWLIAGFSLLIGGFGIANIMFVSVKERTRIIGIQKALGAKKYFIVTQFLTEAVILAIAGALVGILLVALILIVAPIPEVYHASLSLGNAMLGILIASIIGVVSGISPALAAAKLNPVEAINSK